MCGHRCALLVLGEALSVVGGPVFAILAGIAIALVWNQLFAVLVLVCALVEGVAVQITRPVVALKTVVVSQFVAIGMTYVAR